MAWPRRLALDALTALLAVVGVVLVVIGGGTPGGPPERAADAVTRQGPPAPPARPAPPAATPAQPGGGTPAGPDVAAREVAGPDVAARDDAGPAPLGRSVPVGLDIPAIGVSTPLMALGLNPDGRIAVPPLRHDAPAGWYRQLATPGEVGPAVILGHVDTAAAGPAVFYRLRELRPGDTITVRRVDASTAVFTVSQVVEYPKRAFPTDAVYGPVDHPALRLVTCGGAFDPIRREYRGNVVAYARLIATTPG